MKKDLFRLKFTQETTILNKKIIEKYWEFENQEFVHKPSVLRKEYNISQHELNTIIKDNSICEINKGVCIECGIELIHNVTSQTQFKEKNNATIIYCEECDTKYNEKLKKEIKLLEISYKNKKLQKALKKRLWENLSTNEFLILKSIIKIKDRNAIFREIFSQDYKGTWIVVNKLEKIGLIDILRDNNSVISFDFLEELEVEILSLDDKVKTVSSVRNNFSFSLIRKAKKLKPNQPDYSGIFILPSNILLTKGIEYVYGGWIQSDGSINLKFTPKEELFIVTQKDIEQEPKHIKDIISNMFNNKSNNIKEFRSFEEFEDDNIPF